MTTSYSPVLTTKAVKDETEQRILREAHVRRLHPRGCAAPPRDLSMYLLVTAFAIWPQDVEVINLAVQTLNVRLVGEGCRGRHAAADVSGEGGAGGEGVRALGRGLRQRMSQVRSRRSHDRRLKTEEKRCCSPGVWFKHITLSAANRMTAEDRALQPSPQVDPTLPWPTTSTVHIDSASVLLVTAMYIHFCL